MAQLQIGGKFDTLSGRYVAVRYKNHVCNRPSWENGTTDELTDQVNTAVLICDGHDDADGNEQDGAYAKSEKQAVPWQMHRITRDIRTIPYVTDETYYSTTKIPTAVMLTNVTRYHQRGASLYLLISRL